MSAAATKAGAIKLYAGGYYYEAKRKRMLDELRDGSLAAECPSAYWFFGVKVTAHPPALRRAALHGRDAARHVIDEPSPFTMFSAWVSVTLPMR